MSLIALTHEISPDIADGQRTWIDRKPIDLARADQQHLVYRQTLESLGVEVKQLSMNRDYPDSVFMEDPAVVVDEVAVLARMGSKTRRGEIDALEAELARYRTVVHMKAPAALDGGDVQQIGRRIFVGQSSRTNKAGYKFLKDLLTPYGYEVIPVPVNKGSLHLGTGGTFLDEETFLTAKGRVDTDAITGVRIVYTPEGEGWAANTLRIGDTVLVAGGYPHTAELIHSWGHKIQVVDNSELEKAEGSLTCLSLIFNR